jgi:hypothetical protein
MYDRLTVHAANNMDGELVIVRLMKVAYTLMLVQAVVFRNCE